ncbi:MAG: hypothetical protein ACYC5M_10340 [Anaerolineae bacterium]
MLKNLLNFQGVNWWVLVGGMGFNFIITLLTSLAGAYLATAESSAGFYAAYGAPIMLLAVFLLTGLAGYVIGKISDDMPLKHAVLSSLGSFVPFLAAAVLLFQPMMLLMAAISVLGAFNGGVLAQGRPRYSPPKR